MLTFPRHGLFDCRDYKQKDEDVNAITCLRVDP